MSRPESARTDTLAGRADIVWALGQGGDDVAELLGFERVPRAEPKPKLPEVDTDRVRVTHRLSGLRFEPLPAPLWRVEDYTQIEPVVAPPPPPAITKKRRVAPEGAEFQPLARTNRLLTTFRRVVAALRSGRELDVPRIVEQIGRARLSERLPRRRRRVWGRSLWVVRANS